MDTGAMQDRILESTVTYVSVKCIVHILSGQKHPWEQTKMASLIEAR